MEFVINHTRRQIRECTNVSETEIDSYIRQHGWDESDDAEVVALNDDSHETWYLIESLIQDSEYDIPEVFLGLFIPDQTQMSEDYDAQQEDSPTPIYEFPGWDNPGADFDW